MRDDEEWRGALLFMSITLHMLLRETHSTQILIQMLENESQQRAVQCITHDSRVATQRSGYGHRERYGYRRSA